jgi:CRISPR-associated protein (TIGR02584 family)
MAAPPSTVLFAVVGMSPAVLTETVWALAHRRPRVLPERVVVLTTRKARASIERELLAPPSDQPQALPVWDELRHHLRARPGQLRFGATPEDIRVVTRLDPVTGRSSELDDITSPEDNLALGNALLENLRPFTENPRVRLIASLAGGRKTMSALLYACMSLIGREGDEITHVLVNEPYDGPLQPRFYFPGQSAAPLQNPRGGPAVSPRDARVGLATLPFVPLRRAFDRIGGLPGGFADVVAHYRQVSAGRPQPPLVRLRDDGVEIDSTHVPLRGRTLRLLEFLLVTNHGPDAQPFPGPSDAADVFFQEFLPTRPALGNWQQVNGHEQDLRREKNYLVNALAAAGIVGWRPGQRAKSLTLPPFRWENPLPPLRTST